MVDTAHEAAMEFGGYVEPPSHLSKKAKGPPAGLAAELRTVPDYDYSLFRYSRLAAPFLLLIAASAAILFCLTCWQGPLGILTANYPIFDGRTYQIINVNGIDDGVPYDYEVSDNDTEGGTRKPLRNLRIANFVLGLIPWLIAIFAIRAEPRPTFLRIWLFIAAFLFIALWASAAVAFAIGISQSHWGYECERLRIRRGTNELFTASPDPLVCDDRKQLTHATTVADIILSTVSFLLGVVIIFTLLSKNYAWGPGRVAVHKQVDRPKMSFPPPSPFTHIHETRRLYVWFLLFVFIAALILDFTLTIMDHELRAPVTPVDARNGREIDGQIILRGWSTANNRFRLALSSFVFGLALLQLMDLICWKRRWVAYILALLFFFALFTSFIIFGMDVHDVNEARDRYRCPTNLRVTVQFYEPGTIEPRPQEIPVGPITSRTEVRSIRCSQWQYFATCFIDFWLAILILIYLIYEFLYRCNATWDTFYFYADSEWLRNNSLFVEVTDREAYDWQRFTMETGRDYYYSPTLGISTRTRPRNYIDPVAAVPVF